MSESWTGPRRRLRHLHSIQARNLQGYTVEDSTTSAVYATLWSHVRAKERQQKATCLYTTEQVAGTVAPEWLPLDFSASQPAPDQLHGLYSGCIHVHVYKVACQPGSEAQSDLCLAALGHPAATLDLHSAAVGNSDLKGSRSLKSPSEQNDEANNEASNEQDCGNAVNTEKARQRFTSAEEGNAGSSSEAGPRSSLDRRKQEHDSVAGDLPPPAGKAVEPVLDPPETCIRVKAPGELLLSASVDLAALDSLGPDVSALDGLPQRPTLVFGMTDGGFLVWPPVPEGWKRPSAIIQQTASGTAAADATEQEEDKPWRLGSLFRIPTFGSASDASEQRESEDMSSSLPDATRPRLPQKASFGSGSEIGSSTKLRSMLSSGSSAPDPKADPSEVAGEDLQAAMLRLCEAQGRLQAVKAETASVMHRLDEALRLREEGRHQQAALAEVRGKAKRRQDAYQHARQQKQAAAARAQAVRELIAAQGSALNSALSSLEALWEHLDGPEAAYWASLGQEWRDRHRHLVARKCRLAVELQRIFGIGPRSVTIVEAPAEGFLWNKLDTAWFQVSVMTPPKLLPSEASNPDPQTVFDRGPSSRASAAGTSDSACDPGGSDLSIPGSQIREVAQLAIGSLGLEPTVSRSKSDALATIGWGSDHETEVRTGAALGYAAMVTHHLAAFLGIPLKYPIRLANSHSVVLDFRPPLNLADEGSSPTELSLFPDGVDRTRFSYAVFLLNKDVEQLLNAHGFTSVGPSHVLQNLYKLLAAASSAVAPRPHWD